MRWAQPGSRCLTNPSDTIDVRVAAPLAHQRPWLASPARFKIVRAGRRSGKSRAALHASLFGHGPKQQWRGLLQGKDVGWVAPDFKQAETIWAEELKPRFDGVDGWTLSEKNHSLTLDGYGTLFLISYENIRALRGRGKQLGGVVLDEGAHFDLGYAWRSVVRPALMDCRGWAFFASTTNSGPDGATDDQGHRIVPSFFNRLCQQVMAGLRGAAWQHWHCDARQNPAISPVEFEELAAEYDGESQTQLAEEVYANLLHGGAGLAFPEWDLAVHRSELEVEAEWSCALGMDWGHGTPGWAGVLYTRPDQRLYLREELYYKKIRAKKVGFLVGKLCLRQPVNPEYIALDSACFSQTGVGATIAEKLQEGLDIAYQRHNDKHKVYRDPPHFLPAPKGPEALRNQTELVRDVLGWEADKDGTVVEPPLMTVHPDCRDFMRTVAKLPLDPKDPNKFDTKAEDHPIQGLAYLLAARTPEYREPTVNKEAVAMRARLDAMSRKEAESFDALAQKHARHVPAKYRER
jgi:hypothetical protein